jgi:hypothetical protein
MSYDKGQATREFTRWSIAGPGVPSRISVPDGGVAVGARVRALRSA